jgi:hypothetical protein
MAEQSDAEPKKHDQVKAERKVPTAMSHHPSAGMPPFKALAGMVAWWVPRGRATMTKQ